MRDAQLVQVVERLQGLSDNALGVWLIERCVLGQLRIDRAPFELLSDQVQIRMVEIDLIEFDNVGMVNRQQNQQL